LHVGNETKKGNVNIYVLDCVASHLRRLQS